MTFRLQFPYFIILLFVSIGFLFSVQCASPVLVAHPPSAGSPEVVKVASEEKSAVKSTADSQLSVPTKHHVRMKEVDFAAAFDSGAFDSAATSSIPAKHIIQPPALPAASLRYPSYQVQTNKVRVALLQNVPSAVAYSVGVIGFHSVHNDTLPLCRGRVALEARQNNSLTITGAWGTREFAMPCTLVSQNEYNFISLGEHGYRGSLIAVQERPGLLSIVNMLDVEDYIRGVVPLEIGKRSAAEIEALKAQAVAARTYTYKRIMLHQNPAFDLLGTISDQVYGGADVEDREADLAVKLTTDLVMTYNDTIIDAYYHSTCGGKTANVEDVWNKSRKDYLVSISDCDPQGRAYCKDSPLYAWEETWTPEKLTAILMQTYPSGNGGRQFSGTVQKISVDKRFDCGRVKTCTITTNTGSYECGGDQVRFIMRRNTADRSILRSSRFSVAAIGPQEIKISGTGYGHGVGMCQMGALGRAKAGQEFDRILRVYYSGVQLRTAVMAKN